MQHLQSFDDTCSYCYNGLDISLTFCCDMSLCPNHLKFHIEHTPLYTIQKLNDDIFIESIILSKEEIMELKKFVSSGDYKNKMDIIKVNCKHKKDLLTNKKYDYNSECNYNNCCIKNNLYLCLFCGYQGCGRVQYGIEGNGHAFDHYKDTNHFFNVSVDSLGLGSNNTFCYKCENFINNFDVAEALENLKIKYAEIIKEKNTQPLVLDIEEKTDDVKSPCIGIENAGNTCYISSVLQLFAFNDINLYDHMNICTKKPSFCFCCQFIKIQNALNGKLNGNNKLQKIEILKFIECVEKDMLIFQRPMQNDCNEFLFYFLLKLQEYQDLGELPNFTKDYQYKMIEAHQCVCNKNKSIENTNFIFTLPYSKRITKSMDDFILNSSFICDCGEKTNVKMKMEIASKFLLICLMFDRIDTETNKIVYDADFEFENQIDFYGALYEYRANIVHLGDNMKTGHYITKFGNFYINDDKVTNDEKKGYNYIFVYELKK